MRKEKKKTIFLTGATGFVGSYLLVLLLKSNYNLYLLARKRGVISAEERVRSLLNFWDCHVFRKYSKAIKIFEGDIVKDDLGLSKPDIDLFQKNVVEIFHCAAITDFKSPLALMRRVNVEGAANIFRLALQWSQRGILRKVNHISTAYVCGNYKGVFSEDDLNVGQQFDLSYEESKFEAEQVAAKFRSKGLWIDIFRPPVVIGESTSGKIFKAQGFHQTIKIWRSEIFDIFPGANIKMNLLPIDVLCGRIKALAFFANFRNMTYHPFGAKGVDFRKILNMAATYYRFRKPRLIPFEKLNDYSFTALQRLMLQRGILSFNPSVKFKTAKTGRVLNGIGLPMYDLEDAIFRKAIYYDPHRGLLSQQHNLGIL